MGQGYRGRARDRRPLLGGTPLTSVEAANRFGQTYFADPVALVIDAVTYSAGDIFAAGFQDHAIGPVLGTDRQTGGGGANVWPHDFLVQILPDVPEIKPLPGGAKLRVAARRCVRTGSFDGLPIEELGIRADKLHRMTEADVLEDNRDLKAAAIALIADQPARWLEAELVTGQAGRTVEVTATGLDRVDVFVDDRPLTSLDSTQRKASPCVLPCPGPGRREAGGPGLRRHRAEGGAPPARPDTTANGMTNFDGMRPWRPGSFAAS
ncbi:MAG: S41 family peptidase [Geminicoccaceae bacterium]